MLLKNKQDYLYLKLPRNNFCKFCLLLHGSNFTKQFGVATKYISRILLITKPEFNTV